MPVSWNIPLVILSLLVAMIGSFTALTHAQRMRENTGRCSWIWLMTGGVTLGVAIWTMHFVGMLAFHLPVPISYDLQLTLVSILPAIGAALLGFYLLCTPQIRFFRLASGSVLMGLGISVMHYTGMAALKMSLPVIYSWPVVAISVLIAIMAALGALLIVYAGDARHAMLRYGAGSVVMGLAIGGMHYTAMSAATFPVGGICLSGASRIESDILAMLVSTGALFIFAGGMLATLFDRRAAWQKTQTLEQLQHLHAELGQRAQETAEAMTRELSESRSMLSYILDTVPQAIFWKDRNSVYLGCNRMFARNAGLSDPADIVGKTDFDLPWTREESDAYRADDQAVMNSNVAKMHIVQHQHNAAGLDTWVDTSKVPLKNGEVFGVLGVYDDITERMRSQDELHKSEERNRLILDESMDAVISADQEGRVIGWNKEAVRMFGYSVEQAIGKCLTELIVPPVYREAHRQGMQRFVNTGDATIIGHRVEITGMRADGSEFPIELAIAATKGEIGYIFNAFIRDITERRRSGEAMRIAAATFETQEAILITDPESTILRVNQAFQEITGYSTEEVVGNNPRMLQSGRHDRAFYQAMWSALLDTGKWSGEIWDKRKSGEIYPKSMTITAVYDDQHRVTHYVAVFRDISNRKKSEQKIHQLAFYDPLTRLPNRRLLLDRLQQAMVVSMRSGLHGALMFLDMDHFKTINDTQGHAVGDLLLIEVAHRLQACVREGDSVARLGGDEFVVLLEDLSAEVDAAVNRAELIAEKMRAALNKPYTIRDYQCNTSPSIGISLFCGQTESVEDLLMHADVAMYQANSSGRNAIRFFDPKMQTALDARAVMDADMRHALEGRQFILYYQVQVDGRGKATGAEVLLRWQHPDRGFVFPDQFIPLAEETGLIVPIGQWVLETACSQLKLWQKNALTRDLTLAVNVSAKQFRQADFVAQVQRTLLESGAKPSQLKLELTESTVLENVDDTIAKMREIKILGVDFSMDDFGTGYSSLQYLKRLPLNQIKIDKSFVIDIATDPNDAAIVQTIIAMTQAMGLNVIAEGVETVAQRDFLDKNGCHAFQGYLFSKPVPLADFHALLDKLA
ncbi:MAG: EAL domain-containing protein [Gallionella sp.]|nr:EAL domain-containing protein [Gallionella sp.]